jgi:hypothetical protein
LPAYFPTDPVTRAALITGAWVAGGLAVATATLPPLETPGRAAQTFIEARYAEDWPVAWNATCHVARNALGGYTAFTERLTSLNENSMYPSDVDVDIEDTEVVREPGARGFSVAWRATSDERSREWADRGEGLVIREDGEFRVCIPDRLAEVG